MSDYPSVEALTAAVFEQSKWLASVIDPDDLDHDDDGEPFGEVRIQVMPDYGWYWHTGDSSYDQDHRGYWGAASIGLNMTEEEARDTAIDLIDQARDAAAWDAA